MPHVVEPALEELHDVLVIEADEHIAPLFARPDDALVAQPAQLVRHSRFGQAQALHQLPHTNLAFDQGGQNEDARRITQRGEQVGQVKGSFRRHSGLGHVLLQRRAGGWQSRPGVTCLFKVECLVEEGHIALGSLHVIPVMLPVSRQQIVLFAANLDFKEEHKQNIQ